MESPIRRSEASDLAADANELINAKRCTVELPNKTRCPRLATKSIEGQRICRKHYREFKNQLLIEHTLGKSEKEKYESMAKALKEDGDPESLDLIRK